MCCLSLQDSYAEADNLKLENSRTGSAAGPQNGRRNMISWAVTFLIIAIIAAIFGFSGIAGAATNIAWILFVVGLILAIIFAISGRRP